MAIYTGGMRQQDEARATGKRLAREYEAQQAKAQKRGKWSGLLGGVGGKLLGTAVTGALGLTGFGVPLAMALSGMAAKKGAHELTRGMGADVGAISGGDKYGYGREESESLKKMLKSQMAVDPSKEHGLFGRELLSSTLSAGLSGDLGGATKSLMKGGEGSLKAAFFDPEATGGWAGAKESLAGLIPGYSDATAKGINAEDIDLTESLEGSGLSRGQYDRMVESAQANYIDDDTWDLGSKLPISEEWTQSALEGDELNVLDFTSAIQNKAQGGLVSQNTTPTIADYFGKQGVSLGGSNKQSLSQILGR